MVQKSRLDLVVLAKDFFSKILIYYNACGYKKAFEERLLWSHITVNAKRILTIITGLGALVKSVPANEV